MPTGALESYEAMKTWAVWGVLAASLSGCGDEPSPVACTAHAAAGLGVTITDAATGQPVCDATVTASEGNYSEQLFGVSCTFTGAYERPGTYVIRASRAGFVPGTAGPVRVVMGGGPCPHVEQARVTITLTADK